MDRACVHETVHRGTGQVVLVAATGTRAAYAFAMAEGQAGDVNGFGGRPVIKRAVIGMAVAAAGLAFAAPAHADVDTDFANELHIYGIYGQKDYNAWIGKIVCKRLGNGVDTDANKSAQFIFMNLQKDSTTEQSWRFLGAALRTYCPDRMPILEQAAQ
jgi:Protein of unknown function (DUF732)